MHKYDIKKQFVTFGTFGCPCHDVCIFATQHSDFWSHQSMVIDWFGLLFGLVSARRVPSSTRAISMRTPSMEPKSSGLKTSKFTSSRNLPEDCVHVYLYSTIWWQMMTAINQTYGAQTWNNWSILESSNKAWRVWFSSKDPDACSESSNSSSQSSSKTRESQTRTNSKSCQDTDQTYAAYAWCIALYIYIII